MRSVKSLTRHRIRRVPVFYVWLCRARFLLKTETGGVDVGATSKKKLSLHTQSKALFVSPLASSLYSPWYYCNSTRTFLHFLTSQPCNTNRRSKTTMHIGAKAKGEGVSMREHKAG